MKYTHILFDADNTLFDFDETARRALLQLCGDIGLEATEENIALFNTVNQSWWKRIERGEVTFDQLIIGRIIDFFALTGVTADPYIPAENMVHYLGQHSIIFDDAEPLLARLHAHCQLYIITNGISSVQHSRMDSSPLRRYIKNLFISDEIGARKPSCEFFDRVLAELGNIDQTRILVVGDSLSSDIRGGINAGLDTCWYTPNGGSPEELNPTFIAHSLAEVGDIILGEH